MSKIKNIPFNLRVGTFRHIVCYIQTKNKHFFFKKKLSDWYISVYEWCIGFENE